MSEPAPVVTGSEITFRVSDADHRLDGVRLELDWTGAATTLDFHPDGDGWELTIPQPPAERLEYQFTLRTGDHYEWTTDSSNPRRVPNPFGEKSELLMHSYREPEWLDTPDSGHTLVLKTPAGELPEAVPVTVWSPEGLADDVSTPLLFAHDGSDMADRGSILRWATWAQTLPGGPGPFRVALLDPPIGRRDDYYGACDEYADHLHDVVLPAVAAAVPVGALIGLGASLGAVAVAHLQHRHPDSLAGMALQSGSFFTAALDPQESGYSRFDRLCAATEALTARGTARAVPTLTTCGIVEENLANNRALAGALSDQGFDLRWREIPDAHTMIGWRNAWGSDLSDLIRVAVEGSGHHEPAIDRVADDSLAADAPATDAPSAAVPPTSAPTDDEVGAQAPATTAISATEER